jgi:creatinine amidohydrolase
VTLHINTSTSADVGQMEPKLAVLPMGSFEQHGHHLPLVTDTVVACAIAENIRASFPVLALPPITISCSHEHAAWPGTTSISATTLYAVVTDIAKSLHTSGIPSLALINGHGGNYVLSNIVQESTVDEPRMALFPTSGDWTNARNAGGLVTNNHEDMHGGELETSILLAVAPQLVGGEYTGADYIQNDRTHLLSVGMQGLTGTGIIGRPSLASAEKGNVILSQLTKSFGATFQLLTDSTE